METRGVVVARPSSVVSFHFASYPAELIAQWCRVTVETAQSWKTGKRTPSPAALALFCLYRDRKVLGPDWDGWIVKGNRLVDPEGNETTQGQLRAYYFVYQLARELGKRDPAALERLSQLMASAG